MKENTTKTVGDLTAEEIELELIRLAAADPDFQYSTDDGGCSYTRGPSSDPDKCNGCLFGQAFQNLGVPPENLTSAHNPRFARGIHGVWRLYNSDTPIPKGWVEAQLAQDAGYAWGETVTKYILSKPEYEGKTLDDFKEPPSLEAVRRETSAKIFDTPVGQVLARVDDDEEGNPQVVWSAELPDPFRIGAARFVVHTHRVNDEGEEVTLTLEQADALRDKIYNSMDEEGALEFVQGLYETLDIPWPDSE